MGHLLEASGGLLGAPGGILGRSWVYLGPSLGPSGPKIMILDQFLAIFILIWGAFGDSLGTI